MNRTLLLCCILLCACSKQNEGVLHDEGRTREVAYKVWSPEVSGPAPLVLLSHGSGGHYANLSWLTEALLNAGYAVAAVNHPTDTVLDGTPAGVVRVWDRPPDISLLLTSILHDPVFKDAIDSNRIGAAGFSSGGYTVIALAGAIYELERMQSYCSGTMRGPDCNLAPMPGGPEPAASQSFKDDRIKAVFAMAPAVGPAIRPGSLADIAVPVEIIGTLDDELLKPELNSAYYAKYIQGAELILLPKGGHFLFLECDFMTAVADFFITRFNLCERGIDVDRKALQNEIAKHAIMFFDQSIGNFAK